jgi:hypothetical protein
MADGWRNSRMASENSTMKSRYGSVQPRKSSKDSGVDVANWLYKAAALSMVALGIWVIYTTSIEEVVNPPVSYWTGSFASVKPEYYPGEDVVLRVVATKYRLLPGSVAWRLTSDDTGEVFTYAARPPTVKGIGYVDENVHILTLPTRIDPGRYHLEGMITFELNTNKMVSYPLHSDSFTVLPSPNGGTK